MAYIGEHDVRFFEGFLARDAALLHTSDGQLETALTLFGTSIEAFLRSGAVAQLVITLASLPALFERLDRPASPAPCSARWPGSRPASTTCPRSPISVSGSTTRSGEEASERFAATGARDGRPRHRGVRPPPDRPRPAGARRPPAQQGAGAAGLTARETQVLRLIADGATHARDLRAVVHLGEDRRQPHPAHLHQARRDQPRRGHAVGLDHDVVEAGWPSSDRVSAWREMGTRNEEISSCATTARRRRLPVEPAEAGRPGPMAPHGGERHDPGDDEGEGPRPLPGGVRHEGRRQARVARLEGLHGLPRPDRGGPGVGRLRLGRGRAGRRSPPTRRPPASCRRPVTWAGRPWASSSESSPPRGVPTRPPRGEAVVFRAPAPTC